jgi:putative restriction endonuclease
MADLMRDEELRATVFAHVSRLRSRHGGRIPSAELNAGIDFHGTRVPIWNYQKGIFKPAALGREGAALSIQTSVESPYEDSHDPDAGHFVYKYRGVDPDQADNLALRRAMEWQRPLLYLVAIDPGVYDAIFPTYVMGDDRARLQFTLVVDPSLALPGEASSPIVTARREYATRAVMQRLHQQQFRRVVLKAYGERCAICRLGHVTLLDAAHILVDSHPLGEPIVPNGLGLCKIHHSAFDANILGVDPDAHVHIRSDILNEIDGPMLKHGLQEAHGSRLVLPRSAADRPKREFLEERFAEFKAA